MKEYEIVNLEDGYGIEIDGRIYNMFVANGIGCDIIPWSCSFLWCVKFKIWRLELSEQFDYYMESIKLSKMKNRQAKLDEMRTKK
tara:strand:+ start:970 stop:1224 length:255 start_codon:yes stop_codon:yes gene_type:complete